MTYESFGRSVSAETCGRVVLRHVTTTHDLLQRTCMRCNKRRQPFATNQITPIITTTKAKSVNAVAWQGHQTARLYSPVGSIELTVWPQLAIAYFCWGFNPQIFSLEGSKTPIQDNVLSNPTSCQLYGI